MADKSNFEIRTVGKLQIMRPDKFEPGDIQEVSFYSLVRVGNKAPQKQIHGIGTGLTLQDALRSLADDLDNTEIVIDIDLGGSNGN